MSASPGEITILLSQLPDPESLSMLMRKVYNDLHRMAAHHVHQERSNGSLQPTALVSEAYIRLMEGEPRYPNRAYFFGAAAQAMRRILVDRARRQLSQKREGPRRRIDLDEVHLISYREPLQWLALDEALTRLDTSHPGRRQIVELRVFGGFTAREAAEVLGMGESTLRREWTRAMDWLRKEMGSDASDGEVD